MSEPLASQALRVLHILDHSLPLHSGYSFRSQDIFRSQRRLGWTPVALTSPKHEQSWSRTSAMHEEIDGVRYYRTGLTATGSWPVVSEFKLMSALAARLEEIVKKEKPDLLHAHSPILNALPAFWVARKLRLPVVYELRAFWEDAAVDHGTYKAHSWKYRLTKSCETWVCRNANAVAVLCEGIKNDMIQRGVGGEKLFVVPNGVNIDDFGSCDPDEQFRAQWGIGNKQVIAFIGSFYRYEGVDLLVEAFARLCKTRPDVMLLLVGGGEVEAELKSQVRMLNLSERVIMPGRIPHERIPGVYALADILAYPRRSMRLTELVTPLKPLEAMAMGKAVVASNVGGHRELIRDGYTGLLFSAGDALALEHALLRVLDEQALQRQLALQGPLFIRQERTWDQSASVYRALYGQAVAQYASVRHVKRPPITPVDFR